MEVVWLLRTRFFDFKHEYEKYLAPKEKNVYLIVKILLIFKNILLI